MRNAHWTVIARPADDLRHQGSRSRASGEGSIRRWHKFSQEAGVAKSQSSRSHCGTPPAFPSRVSLPRYPSNKGRGGECAHAQRQYISGNNAARGYFVTGCGGAAAEVEARRRSYAAPSWKWKVRERIVRREIWHGSSSAAPRHPSSA
jgi:hypothetical protein